MSNIDPNISFETYEHEPPRVREIKKSAAATAKVIQDQAPASAEATLALRKLEEAVHWAVAAIDREPAYQEAKKRAAAAEREKKKAA